MHADLKRLIALQQLDSTADEAHRHLAEEPGRQRDFDGRLAAARERVDGANTRLSENQETRRAIEKAVAVHQARLSKFRDQLMLVKTNVEYQAVQKEIEFAQKEVKNLEDKVLEAMLEADELSDHLKQAEAALADVEKEVNGDRLALDQHNSTLRERLERISHERDELVGTLEGGVLEMFELVASRRNGVAVAEAKDGVCTICHVRLRPQVFNDVMQNAKMIQCDSCQRFLYFAPSQTAAGHTQPPAP